MKMKEIKGNPNLSGNNVIQTIKPLYLIGKFLGIMPFDIINGSVKFSWLGLFFSFAIFSNLLHALLLNMFQIRGSQRMNQLVSIGDLCTYAFCTWAFFISHMVSTKKYFSIYKKILQIDNLFKTLNVIFPHKKDKKKILILFILGVVFSFTMLMGVSLAQSTIGRWLPWYFIFVHNWDELCKIWFLINSFAVAYILKERFKMINKKLGQFKRDKELANGEKINQLRILHDDLCDVCEIFNKLESLPCIFLLLLVFVVTITNTYYFYSYWYNHGDKIELGLVRMILAVSHFMFYGVFLFPFFVGLAKEANRTGIAVHKVIGKLNDVESEYELDIFSRQLLHRKVQFTANGFFPLDYSFLFTMIGTITSYLVMLIQFQNLTPATDSSSIGFDIS